VREGNECPRQEPTKEEGKHQQSWRKVVSPPHKTQHPERARCSRMSWPWSLASVQCNTMDEMCQMTGSGHRHRSLA